MPDFRDLKFIKDVVRESDRPALEHGIIGVTPTAYDEPIPVILPEFSNDQYWGPCLWTAHFNGDFPQAGDDCLIAFSNRRDPWIVAWWPGSNMVVGGGGVTSVFARTGAVVAAAGDYTVAQVTGAAPLAGPVFTGDPQAPTPATADNDTSIATTAFVKNQGYLTVAPVTSVFGRTGAVVAASGDYTVAQVTGAAPLVSPTFTGTPTAPTAAAGTNTTQVATTAFVQSAIASRKIAYAEFTSTVNATGTTPVAAVSAGAVTFDGSTEVEITCYVPEWTASDNSAGCQIVLMDGTGTVCVLMSVNGVSGGSGPNQPGGTWSRILTPGVGSHTYKLGVADVGAVTSVHARVLAGTGSGTLAPGFIMIRRTS